MIRGQFDWSRASFVGLVVEKSGATNSFFMSRRDIRRNNIASISNHQHPHAALNTYYWIAHLSDAIVLVDEGYRDGVR